MKNIIHPVVFASAFFIGYLLIDLFRYNYEELPGHALIGFFLILIISVLCQNNMYGFAWLLLASPIIFIIASIMIRDHRRAVSASKTLPPGVEPKKQFDPAPYYL